MYHDLTLGWLDKQWKTPREKMLEEEVSRLQERLKAEKEAARQEGYKRGYQEAQNRYAVSYWCSRCRRRHLTITSAEEKEAAANYMYQHGWHDSSC